MTKVAILCGGQGTRMRSSGEQLPKPLVEVGGRPILWHVMSIYAAQRLDSFVLLLGFGADRVRAFAATLPWNVECVDTGLETPTGGRVRRAEATLADGPFHLTYADGVADIDLAALGARHRAHGKLATITVVRPRNPWGVAELDADGRVTSFSEKPRLESWVNGGFMVLEPGAIEQIGADESLEDEPLQRLAEAGELHAYRHDGFWDCMDTYKDTILLNELWDSGRAPWRGLVEA